MAKPIKHFRTITKHRHRVIAHCSKVGILWQGLRHDLSKYTPTEFLEGARNYKEGKRSPNEEARAKNGYSLAWMHHKGRNRHHFEYWTDTSPVTRRVEPVEMPIRFVAEMFCDRVAASKIYRGKEYTDASALEYFERGRDRRNMHPTTSDLLESWLRLLAEQGEAAAFAAVRAAVKEAKKGKKK